MPIEKMEQKFTRDIVVSLWPKDKPLDEELVEFFVSVLMGWTRYRSSVRSMLRVHEKLNKDILGDEPKEEVPG